MLKPLKRGGNEVSPLGRYRIPAIAAHLHPCRREGIKGCVEEVKVKEDISMRKIIPYDKGLKAFARQLRNQSTQSELSCGST